MLDIGFNGRLFPNQWRPLVNEIGFAEAHGFSCIQIMTAGSVDETLLGGTFGAIRHALEGAGVELVVELDARISKDGRLEDGREGWKLLRDNERLFSELPVRCAHFHYTVLEPATPAEIHHLELALQPQLLRAMAFGARLPFPIAIENNSPQVAPFQTPASCAAVLEAVPSLAFIWDVNHTLPDLVPAYHALASSLSMVHVSDCRPPQTNEHLPLGQGNLDLAAYLAPLAAGNFAGPAILEIGGLPHSGGFGQDTDSALVDSLARLRDAWRAAEQLAAPAG